MTRTRYPNRKPVVIPTSVEIQANRDHVVMIVPVGNGTVGIRFESPEHMLSIFHELMAAAQKVWPDNEWIQEYQSEDE